MKPVYTDTFKVKGKINSITEFMPKVSLNELEDIEAIEMMNNHLADFRRDFEVKHFKSAIEANRIKLG
jgi:hypothetical protein